MSWAMHAWTVGSNPIGSRRLVGLFRAYTYVLIPPASPIGSSLTKRLATGSYQRLRT
jgi:hypothetical protein